MGEAKQAAEGAARRRALREGAQGGMGGGGSGGGGGGGGAASSASAGPGASAPRSTAEKTRANSNDLYSSTGGSPLSPFFAASSPAKK